MTQLCPTLERGIFECECHLPRLTIQVGIKLSFSEVSPILEFFCRFWWVVSHLSPAYWAGLGEQLCGDCQRTSAGWESAGACWVFPSSMWGRGGGLPGFLPMWVGTGPVTLSRRPVEHIGMKPAELASPEGPEYFFINPVPWHQTPISSSFPQRLFL